jgi:hypothetical protein
MPDVKIKDLPLAAASGTSVVPVMNPAGTATNSVTLSSIAALGGGQPASHSASHAIGGSDAVSPASIGAAASSHAHGNLTSDGKVGALSGLPLITGAAGAVTAGTFGADAGTFCEGNDARITGSRTPTSHASSHATGGSDALSYTDIGAAPVSHAHGNISNAGAIGTTSGLPVITTTSGVLTTGVFGSSGGTFCVGNDSRLSDARTPTAHAASHATGGSDAVTLALSQVTNAVGSVTAGITGAVAITNIVKVTQAQYDAISSKSSTTLYIIVG